MTTEMDFSSGDIGDAFDDCLNIPTLDDAGARIMLP